MAIYTIAIFAFLLVAIKPEALAVSSSESKVVQTSNGLVRYGDYRAVNVAEQYNEIDGATSASQLRAKKSHAGAKQNETKLTIFLGLFVIALIVFFVDVLTKKKK